MLKIMGFVVSHSEIGVGGRDTRLLHGMKIPCVEPGSLAAGWSLSFRPSVRVSGGAPLFCTFFGDSKLEVAHFFSASFSHLDPSGRETDAHNHG